MQVTGRPFLLMIALAVMAIPSGAGQLLPLGDAQAQASGERIEMRPGIWIEPGTPWVSHAPGDIQWACPTGNQDTLLSPPGNTNVQVIRTGCPFRIIDDADLLGSPQLGVRHDDAREIAFFSLHGAANDRGPTPRSRDPDGAGLGGLSHTTFMSTNEGWDWVDNPWGNEGFGEMASGLINRDGNIFISALFSRPLGEGHDGEQAYDYHFRLYKENTVHERAGYHGKLIENRAPGNTIEEVNLVVVTPKKYIETQEDWEAYLNETSEDEREERARNGTYGPSDDKDVGNNTIPAEEEDYSKDIVAAVWFERAYDWRNSTTGKSSWIDMMWTDGSSRNDWTKLDDKALIGPCRDASNPEAWNGRIYVACVVDAGYTGRRGAHIGDVDVWVVDPAKNEKRLLGMVPGLEDGRPRIAMNDEGLMAITTTKPLGEEPPFKNIRVQLAWGWYGRVWNGQVFNIGHHLHGMWDVPALTARVTQMELLTDPQVLYISYIERSADPTPNPEYNPNSPPEAQVIEYHKSFSTFENCVSNPSAAFDLQIGVARHPFQEGIVNGITGAFDDLQDGMVAVYDPVRQEEILYFAYGDHGVIQYGALVGASAQYQCPDMSLPVLFTPAPVPAVPALLTTGASVGLASAMGTGMALGLGYLLVMKRKVALAAAAKARK